MAFGMLSSMATDTSEKVRENLLRRIADRQGLALRKSRSRDRKAIDFDRWAIQDLTTGEVSGLSPLGRPVLTLDEVETNLMGDDAS